MAPFFKLYLFKDKLGGGLDEAQGRQQINQCHPSETSRICILGRVRKLQCLVLAKSTVRFSGLSVLYLWGGVCFFFIWSERGDSEWLRLRLMRRQECWMILSMSCALRSLQMESFCSCVRGDWQWSLRSADLLRVQRGGRTVLVLWRLGQFRQCSFLKKWLTRLTYCGLQLEKRVCTFSSWFIITFWGTLVMLTDFSILALRALILLRIDSFFLASISAKVVQLFLRTGALGEMG